MPINRIYVIFPQAGYILLFYEENDAEMMHSFFIIYKNAAVVNRQSVSEA